MVVHQKKIELLLAQLQKYLLDPDNNYRSLSINDPEKQVALLHNSRAILDKVHDADFRREYAVWLAKLPDRKQVIGDLASDIETYDRKFKTKVKAISQEQEELMKNFRQKFREDRDFQDKYWSDPEATISKFRPKGYLASGTYGEVYKFDIEARDYVLKLPKDKLYHEIEAEVASLKKAQGIDSVVKLQAYSYEDSAIVLDFVKGSNLMALSAEDLANITKPQIKKVLEDISELHNRGAKLDSNPANLIYHAENGFTLVDLTDPLARNYEKYLYFIFVAIAITCKLVVEPGENRPYDQKVQEEKAALLALKNFFEVMREDFPEYYKQFRDNYQKNKFQKNCVSENYSADPNIMTAMTEPLASSIYLSCDDEVQKLYQEILKENYPSK